MEPPSSSRSPSSVRKYSGFVYKCCIMHDKYQLSVTVSYSMIFSPVEKRFHTTVPTKYSPTETLKTSSQEPGNKQRERTVSNSCSKENKLRLFRLCTKQTNTQSSLLRDIIKSFMILHLVV